MGSPEDTVESAPAASSPPDAPSATPPDAPPEAPPDTPPDTPSAAGPVTGPRIRRRLALRATRTQAVIGLLFVLLGFAVAATVRGTDDDGFLLTARSEDLVRVLDDLSARQARLEAEARRLEIARDRLEAGSDAAAVAEVQRRADALAILAGTVAATGPGVVVTIADPDRVIDAATLLDAVQELRDAGAEAIAIGGVRVVASTWFADEGDAVVVDGVEVPPPFVLTAIGDPDTLATALEIPGGVADTVRTAGGRITVEGRDQVDVVAVVPGPDAG